MKNGAFALLLLLSFGLSSGVAPYGGTKTSQLLKEIKRKTRLRSQNDMHRTQLMKNVFDDLNIGTHGLSNIVVRIATTSALSFQSLETDINRMKINFRRANTSMYEVRKGAEHDYLSSKNDESLVTRHLRTVEREQEETNSNLEFQKGQLAASRADNNYAKKKYDKALNDYYREKRKYNEAKKEQKHWETVCLSTCWIPFVNIGTCVKMAVEDGDLNSASVRKHARARNWKNTLKLYNNAISSVRNQENQLKKIISDLYAINNDRRLVEQQTLQLENKNQQYSRTVQDLQLLNTELDIVFQRSKGYYGSSMDSVVMRLEHLLMKLTSERSVLKIDGPILESISRELTKMNENKKKFKMKASMWL